MTRPKLTPRQWREHAGYTLDALAKALAIAGATPRSTYAKYENGSRQVPARVVAAVSQLSGDRIGFAEFHAVRTEWLRAQQRKQSAQGRAA